MRKSVITLTMVCLAMIYSAFSQVISDAGPDSVVCAGIHPMDTITIGGSPYFLRIDENNKTFTSKIVKINH